MKRQDIDLEKLKNLYYKENKSQIEISNIFGCSVDLIRAVMKDNSMKRKQGSWLVNSPIKLTDTQMEVINGALLGDGHLTNLNRGNSQFSYLSKTKSHVKYVFSYVMEFITKEGIKENKYFDKRTEKTYTSYSARTQLNITFTELRKKWYCNKKIIPNDLILTPLTCLIWYIGDGSMNTSGHSQYIKLSTNCFTYEDLNNIIIPQMTDFSAKLMKVDKNCYCIRIPHVKIRRFLDYIGECPFDEYSYKWKYKEYKNKPAKAHKDKEDEFIKLYKEGWSYYKISKYFNIEPNAVKYYLIKNKLYEVHKSDKK